MLYFLSACYLHAKHEFNTLKKSCLRTLCFPLFIPFPPFQFFTRWRWKRIAFAEQQPNSGHFIITHEVSKPRHFKYSWFRIINAIVHIPTINAIPHTERFLPTDNAPFCKQSKGFEEPCNNRLYVWSVCKSRSSSFLTVEAIIIHSDCLYHVIDICR